MQSNTNTLREYYLNQQMMVEKALNLLNAINQSLTTSSSSIKMNYVDTDNVEHEVRIPSFLYLENRIEQLENNFDNLFNIPKNGEAWFSTVNDMHKLQLVKGVYAPIIPNVNTDAIGFMVKDNNFFKDLINPNTYIKFNLDNIPDNISEIYVKKFIFYSKDIFSIVSNFTTYNEYNEALFNMKKGVDYDEYDSIVKMPIKSQEYKSEFKIYDVEKIDDSGESLIRYKVIFDKITYNDINDSVYQYRLKKGDILTFDDDYALYKIIDIVTTSSSNIENNNLEYTLTIEEYIGHINLQTYDENSSMVMHIYEGNFNKYKYVEIPLEENQYVSLFVSSIYNNVKSEFSNAIPIDLNSVYMIDNDGNIKYDEKGNQVTYIDYYNEYCKNIGDIIYSISNTIYDQLEDYTTGTLQEMLESTSMKNLVTSTLYLDDNLVVNVIKINDHLVDDVTSENIITLYKEKTEMTSQLNSVQSNIDSTYNQLISTDFSTQISITQNSLKQKLNEYYAERISLQKQLIAIIDNINILKSSAVGISKSKYRIRGITNAYDKYDSTIESPIISYIKSHFKSTCSLIGLEVEYKYKSTLTDNTQIENVTNSVFTNWNRLDNIDKERYVKFNDNGKYEVDYINYSNITNIIKWNQIDIPIKQGESVVFRIRYKYNVGQPFINLYTPWSDEISIDFPVEFIDSNEISTIINENDTDVLNSKFTATLINEGYQEHISNKIIDNSQIFFHMPENIYSGFMTSENKLISLKDKLNSMNNDINNYKELINNYANKQYKVYIEYDGNTIELTKSSQNSIVINDIMDNLSNSFIRKDIKLIVKNVGQSPIKLYSIFPGPIDMPLIESEYSYYNGSIGDYERVPILVENIDKAQNIRPQNLGQWLYFRQNNPYNNSSLYHDTYEQRKNDLLTIDTNMSFLDNKLEYIKTNNSQLLIGYRERNLVNNYIDLNTRRYGEISLDDSNDIVINKASSKSYLELNPLMNSMTYKGNFMYNEIKNSDNSYLLKYEHILMESSTSTNKSYFTNADAMNTIPSTLTNKVSGGFFIPELLTMTQILCDTDETNQYKLLDVGNILVIPLIFEYYLDNNVTEITKTISFDIKSGLLDEPDNYVVAMTAKYNNTHAISEITTSSVYSDYTIDD